MHVRWVEIGQHYALVVWRGDWHCRDKMTCGTKYNLGINSFWDAWISRQATKKFLGKGIAFGKTSVRVLHARDKQNWVTTQRRPRQAEQRQQQKPPPRAAATTTTNKRQRGAYIVLGVGQVQHSLGQVALPHVDQHVGRGVVPADRPPCEGRQHTTPRPSATTTTKTITTTRTTTTVTNKTRGVQQRLPRRLTR